MIRVILSTSIIFLVLVAVRKFFRGKLGNVFLYSLWLLFAAGLVVPVLSAVLQDITGGERGRVESPVSIMNLVNIMPFLSDKADVPEKQDVSVQQGMSAGKDVSGQQDMSARQNMFIQKDVLVQQGVLIQQQEGIAGEGGNTEKRIEQDMGKIPEEDTREKTETKAADGRKMAGGLAGGNRLSDGMSWIPWKYILFAVWGIGTMAVLWCQLTAERSFRRQLIENREAANCLGQKVYVVAGIKTPLLFRDRGLSSAIYLPEAIMGNEMLVSHAILHENVHRRHGDIWWGYVRNLLVAIYWFYPLVWVAAILSKRDCEYACDSSVMKRMDRKERISYGNSLLSLIQVGESEDLFCTATAMKMGKSEMEVRIRMIQGGRKRNIFVTVFVVLLICVAGMAAFTDAMEPEKGPVKEQGLSSEQQGQNRQVLSEEEFPKEKQPGQERSEEGLPKEKQSGQEMSKEGLPKERQQEQEKMLSVKEAEYELTDSWGADMPYICYEDDTRMIFAGYFGLFVYSRETKEIIQSLNLEEIGCNMTQGDQYCEINVSEDGKIVYLHVLKDEKMYQYALDTKELQYLDYQLPGKLYNRKKWEKTHQSEIQSIRSVTIGDLVYWYADGDTIRYEPLFYKPYGSCAFFKPEDIRDLSEVRFYVNGEEYVITEKKKLKWIEKHFSGSAEEIKGSSKCPFYRIMYLKREDGVCGKIFPATDSCSVYQAGDSFYDYKEETNEKFWKLLGIEDMSLIM